MILKEKDPIGSALLDYLEGRSEQKIKVESDITEDDLMDPEYFFRDVSDMPEMEQTALGLSRGKVLDVGAGAGCHALALEKKGLDVVAIDISTLSVQVMSKRGVKNARVDDIFEIQEGSFDTILLLMNGVGIAKTVDGLNRLLLQCKKLLAPGGQILMDSSDIIYMFEDEEGGFYIDINAKKYYGEVTYQLFYKNVVGEPFSWLYVSADILENVAKAAGMRFELIEEGPHYDYLARITRF